VLDLRAAHISASLPCLTCTFLSSKFYITADQTRSFQASPATFLDNYFVDFCINVVPVADHSIPSTSYFRKSSFCAESTTIPLLQCFVQIDQIQFSDLPDKGMSLPRTHLCLSLPKSLFPIVAWCTKTKAATAKFKKDFTPQVLPFPISQSHLSLVHTLDHRNLKKSHKKIITS